MSTSILSLPSHMAGFLHELGPPASGVYTFVSYPSAILPNRPKYRSDQLNSSSSSAGAAGAGGHHGPVNIMSDRRVVRGNTYAINQRVSMRSWPVTSTDDEVVLKHRQTDRRGGYVRRRVLPHIGRNHINLGASGQSSLSKSGGGGERMVNGELRADRLVSNDAQVTAARARVRRRLIENNNREEGGRRHLDIQTEKWLEEIKDRLPEAEVAVQTDEVEGGGGSRPGSPLYRTAAESSMPPGLDKSTQILPDDPDLFVFDDEVAIVLEALVGRTLEQSLLEVIEEEEELMSVVVGKLKLSDES